MADLEDVSVNCLYMCVLIADTIHMLHQASYTLSSEMNNNILHRAVLKTTLCQIAPV